MASSWGPNRGSTSSMAWSRRRRAPRRDVAHVPSGSAPQQRLGQRRQHLAVEVVQRAADRLRPRPAVLAVAARGCRRRSSTGLRRAGRRPSGSRAAPGASGRSPPCEGSVAPPPTRRSRRGGRGTGRTAPCVRTEPPGDRSTGARVRLGDDEPARAVLVDVGPHAVGHGGCDPVVDLEAGGPELGGEPSHRGERPGAPAAGATVGPRGSDGSPPSAPGGSTGRRRRGLRSGDRAGRPAPTPSQAERRRGRIPPRSSTVVPCSPPPAWSGR